MTYVGKWQFHSIGTVDDETCERVWMNAEEYMNSPMLYIDETDDAGSIQCKWWCTYKSGGYEYRTGLYPFRYVPIASGS